MSFRKLLIIIILQISLSCGTSDLGQSSSEKAVKFLEKNDPDSAIEILLESLGANVSDIYNGFRDKNEAGSYVSSTAEITTALKAEVHTLVSEGKNETAEQISILSAAHSQKHGIDPFDIALKLATTQSSESQSSAIMILYPALPDATDENKRGLGEAIAILNSLSPEHLSSADQFKLSILSMANMSLTTKALDTSPTDGKLSAEEIFTLSNQDAETIVDLILTAAEASLSSLSSESGESTEVNSSTVINELKSRLESSEGTSTSEQVQNFMIEEFDLEQISEAQDSVN